jgi:hypothetical protein
MHPLKAPGPDGFSACFYQRHWATIGNESAGQSLHFLNSGILDPDINTTYIAFDPKSFPC